MRFRRIIALLVISLLISSNAYAEINNLSTTISLADWFNTEEGREYIGAGITTYYVGDGLDDNLTENTTVVKPGSVSAMNTTLYSSQIITCNITYEIVKSNNLSVDVDYVVYNGYSTTKSVFLIAALYNDNKLSAIETKSISITPSTSGTENLVFDISEKTGNCSVKLMVWDSIHSMKPISNYVEISNLQNYVTDKHLYINSASGNEIPVYMNVTNSESSSNAIHSISYDPTKFEIADLCGFTYEKELDTGTIDNTDVIIESVDSVNGIIKFRFSLPTGLNTGVTNILKLKALSNLENEQILYTVE